MKEKTTGGVKRRKYDASFKEEVLRMIYNGRPASEVAQSLGIRENLIYKWKSRHGSQLQQPATVSKGNSSLLTPGRSARALETHLELGQERDIRLRRKLCAFSAVRPEAVLWLHPGTRASISRTVTVPGT